MRRLLRPLPSILLVAACVATAAVSSAQTTTTDAPVGQSGNARSGEATIESGGVTRLKWKADGTVEGNTSALVGVFNVRHFGAKGDGKADDTAAVTVAVRAVTAAGGGTLYFPRGTYKTSGGFVFNVPVIVRGDGMGEPIGTAAGANSKVTCTSPTAVVFTFTALYSKVQDIAIVNTSPKTPTAGSGIVATHASVVYNKVDYDNVLVAGFYDGIDSQSGAGWEMKGGYVGEAVRHAIRIRNINHPDSGDWSISGTVVSQSAYEATGDGIHIESSGAGKIVNVKINGSYPSGGRTLQYMNGIGVDLATAGTTSTLLVSNSSIENVRGHGIYARNWALLSVVGVEMGLFNNYLNNLVHLVNTRDVIIDGVVAQNNASANIAFWFENCSRVTLGNNQLKDYQYTQHFAGTYTASGGTPKFNPIVSEWANSWANTAGNPNPAGYAYMNGVVHLKGHVSSGAINTTILTLPVGPWRPTTARIFKVYNNGSSCSITINTNGTVVQGDGASNLNVSLDGISFVP